MRFALADPTAARPIRRGETGRAPSGTPTLGDRPHPRAIVVRAPQSRRVEDPRHRRVAEQGEEARPPSSGRDYTVKASFGHVADLPPKDYGVDLATLEESYVLRGRRRGRQGSCARPWRAAAFDRVLLASDPDREGEAIAWHLARQLKLPGARTRGAHRVPRDHGRGRAAPPSRAAPDRRARAWTPSARAACSTASSASTARRRSAGPPARSRPGAARRRRCTSSASASARSSPSPRARTGRSRRRTPRGFTAFVPADRRDAAGRRAAGPSARRRGRRRRDDGERKGPPGAAPVRDARGGGGAARRGARGTRTSCATCTRGAPSAARRRPTRPPRCSRTPAASCACRPSRRWTPRRRCSRRGSSPTTAPTRRACPTRRWTMARAFIGRAPPRGAARAGAARPRAAGRARRTRTRPSARPRSRGRSAAGAGREAVRDDPRALPRVAVEARPCSTARRCGSTRARCRGWPRARCCASPGFLVFWGPYARQEDVVLPALARGQHARRRRTCACTRSRRRRRRATTRAR